MPRGRKRTASEVLPIPLNSKRRKRSVKLDVPTAPDKSGYVLVCGRGLEGQLGLGERILRSFKFRVVEALGNKIVCARAGGMHTVALDSDGKVWTFGCNDEGALGRPTSSETDRWTPEEVSLPLGCVALTAGGSHSAALLSNGDVYVWGTFRDSHGSMGVEVVGREGVARREPLKVDVGEAAADIASGSDHLVILTTRGTVYTMGCGEQGQLGRVTPRSSSRTSRHGVRLLLVPGKVVLRPVVTRIWAGHCATFAFYGTNEKMFAWGLNNFGQLGVTGEKNKRILFKPKECDAFGELGAAWSAVACGPHHSLALDEAGHVYAVGRYEYGSIWRGDRSGASAALEPVPMVQSKRCVGISARNHASFVVSDSGIAYSWGLGSEGHLGTGLDADFEMPTWVYITAVTGVSVGGHHTVICVDEYTPEDEPATTSETEASEPCCDIPDDDSEAEAESEESRSSESSVSINLLLEAGRDSGVQSDDSF